MDMRPAGRQRWVIRLEEQPVGIVFRNGKRRFYPKNYWTKDPHRSKKAAAAYVLAMHERESENTRRVSA